MIFHDIKTLFLHPGKTGGTTIEIALSLKENQTFNNLNPKVANYRIMYGLCREHNVYLHHADIRFYELNNIELPQSYTKIVSIRRPYEKILSAYYYNSIDQKFTFEDFILNHLESYISKNNTFAKNHFCPQVYYYNPSFNIIKLENIQSDCQKLNIELKDNIHHCKTKASQKYNNHIDAYNQKMKDTVYSLYKEDFLTFNYY